MACWYAGFQLDGRDVEGGGPVPSVACLATGAFECVGFGAVRLAYGTHAQPSNGWGENVSFIAHSDTQQTYPCRTLEIWDRGVASDNRIEGVGYGCEAYIVDTIAGRILAPIDLPSFSWSVSVSDSSLATTKDKGVMRMR